MEVKVGSMSRPRDAKTASELLRRHQNLRARFSWEVEKLGDQRIGDWVGMAEGGDLIFADSRTELLARLRPEGDKSTLVAMAFLRTNPLS